MYLFLDFDGVLHKEFCTKEELFNKMYLLESLIYMVDDLKIVISSAWREKYELKYLLNIFPEKVRERIHGKTPIHPYGQYRRFREILLFLEDMADNNWIAIDDKSYLYPDTLKNLYVCDGLTGLTENDLSKILELSSMPQETNVDNFNWSEFDNENLNKMNDINIRKIVNNARINGHADRFLLTNYAKNRGIIL